MTARRMVLKAMAWRGEDGEPAEFSAVPPPGYEGYKVGGTLRVVSRDKLPEVDVITVTDKETGATVAMRGEVGTLEAPADAAPEYVKGLWADSRHLAGLVRRFGRPPRVTIIENDEQVGSVIRRLGRDRVRVTQKAVAATSGKFTVGNLRSYLRVTGRKWRDFRDTY